MKTLYLCLVFCLGGIRGSYGQQKNDTIPVNVPMWAVSKVADPGFDLSNWLTPIVQPVYDTSEAKKNLAPEDRKIFLCLTIDTTGAVTNVKILSKELGYGLDEAIRNIILAKIPAFKKPAYQYGKPHASYYRVTFILYNQEPVKK